MESSDSQAAEVLMNASVHETLWNFITGYLLNSFSLKFCVKDAIGSVWTGQITTNMNVRMPYFTATHRSLKMLMKKEIVKTKRVVKF